MQVPSGVILDHPCADTWKNETHLYSAHHSNMLGSSCMETAAVCGLRSVQGKSHIRKLCQEQVIYEACQIDKTSKSYTYPHAPP